ncbi:hypothetical protein J3459_007569 [Metarhizium acridum]|nr:hypothetical protein J3459_007569 [Metarhizium acridum]
MELWLRLPQFRLQTQTVLDGLCVPDRPNGCQSRSPRPGRWRRKHPPVRAHRARHCQLGGSPYLLNDLKVKIVQKLIPKLQSEGYVETEDAEEAARSERRGQERRNPQRPFDPSVEPNIPYHPPGPLPQMARPRPGAPVGDFPPPGFEDEYEINRPPRGNPIAMPGGRHPFNIGHDDLNPPGLGPHDPLRGSFVPGGLPRPVAPSGMHPTFDDPLFTGQGGNGDYGGYDPQAPPGARWDPVGPGGTPRFPGPGQGPGSGPFSGSGGFGGGHII